MMQRPPKFYKYQPFTAQSLVNLKRRVMFFARPSRFNDPFDCRYQLFSQNFTARDLSEILEGEKDGQHLIASATSDPAFLAGLLEHVSERVRSVLDRQFASRGVSCLSSRNDSLLMWGHYADGHRGFCLEFDGSAEMFLKAKQVVYQSEYPKISAAQFIQGKDPRKIFETAMCTKSIEWSYEDEWRVFHSEADKAYCYGVDVLTGIYFGAEMEYVHKDLLSLVVKGSSTKLYQMHLSKTGYTLEAEHVEYIAHPQAGGEGHA